MRAQEVYDNTTIVLLSDTGAPISGPPPEKMFFGKVKAFSTATGGLLKPLFAIKPKSADGAFQVSTAPLMLSDLRATLWSLAITYHENPHGLNAFNVAPDMQRERTFVDGGTWVHQLTAKTDFLPPNAFARYTIGGSPEELENVYDYSRRPPAP